MKKILVLMLAAMLLLCGCGRSEPSTPAMQYPVQPPVLPQTEPVSIPPLEYPQMTVPPAPETVPTEPPVVETVPQTMPPVEVTEPKPPVNTIWVEDAYYEVYTDPGTGLTRCVHIPRIVWNGRTDLVLNEQIYFDHQGKIFADGGFSPNIHSAYSLGQAKGYASVITEFTSAEDAPHFYSLFHINIATGQEATDDEILAAFGYSKESFRHEVYRVLEENYERNNPNDGTNPEYDSMMALQLSGSNIDICRPCIDEKGRLCAAGFSYGFSFEGKWYDCLCLETGRPVRPDGNCSTCD